MQQAEKSIGRGRFTLLIWVLLIALLLTAFFLRRKKSFVIHPETVR